MSVNREEVLEKAQEIADGLKEFNDVLDEAGPIVLPEVARFLQHCTPIAEMLSDYLMGPRFQAAVRYNTASQVALTLLQQGKDPNTVATEADRIVRELKSLTDK